MSGIQSLAGLDPARRALLIQRMGAGLDPARRKLLQCKLAKPPPAMLLNRSSMVRESSAGGAMALTPRWYPLRPHLQQHLLFHSTARYRVVPAGRRSGKTEVAKRYLVLAAMCAHSDANFFAGAPTEKQAKRIWLRDLVELSPAEFVADIKTSPGEMFIEYVNGARIWIVGTDVAARIEGTPWDGGILDEFANMKAEVWSVHLRPVMAERRGWCWFIGVPEGHNHYYDLFHKALAQGQAKQLIDDGFGRAARDVLESAYGRKDADVILATGAIEWDAFTWPSEDILDASEIEAARRDMDEDLFEQEFRAAFTAFRGRAYKNFKIDTHVAPCAHKYNDRAPLILTFDFNVSPGTAAVIQEHDGKSMVIGEVHIPYDSTTRSVCRKIVSDWEGHDGPVFVYGDASGGGRSTQASKSGENDWIIVKEELTGKFDRISYRVPRANPGERTRLNTVNARIENALGERHLLVDPVRAPRVVRDFEGVRLLEGGNGEIAKTGESNSGLTHLTDGIGYYFCERWPMRSHAEVDSFRGGQLVPG